MLISDALSLTALEAVRPRVEACSLGGDAVPGGRRGSVLDKTASITRATRKAIAIGAITRPEEANAHEYSQTRSGLGMARPTSQKGEEARSRVNRREAAM